MKFHPGDIVQRKSERTGEFMPDLYEVVQSHDGDPVKLGSLDDAGKVWDAARPEHLRLAEPILMHFRFAHLPEHLQKASRPFGELARRLIQHFPRNAERSVALRKLLEAKDAAVRALIEG